VSTEIGWRPVVGEFTLFMVDVEDVTYIGYDPDTSGQPRPAATGPAPAWLKAPGWLKRAHVHEGIEVPCPPDRPLAPAAQRQMSSFTPSTAM
jgi:hypothetical protein